MLESGSWGHSVLQTPALVLFVLRFYGPEPNEVTDMFGLLRGLLPHL